MTDLPQIFSSYRTRKGTNARTPMETGLAGGLRQEERIRWMYMKYIRTCDTWKVEADSPMALGESD